MHRPDRRGRLTTGRLGRASGAAFLVGSLLGAAGLWAADAPRLTGPLLDHAPVYGVAVAWLVVAPAALAVALALTLRTPWPWVAAASWHLVVVTGVVVRLRRFAPWWSWGALLLAVVVGVLSVVLLVGAAQERRSTTTST